MLLAPTMSLLQGLMHGWGSLRLEEHERTLDASGRLAGYGGRLESLAKSPIGETPRHDLRGGAPLATTQDDADGLGRWRSHDGRALPLPPGNSQPPDAAAGKRSARAAPLPSALITAPPPIASVPGDDPRRDDDEWQWRLAVARARCGLGSTASTAEPPNVSLSAASRGPNTAAAPRVRSRRGARGTMSLASG